MRRQRISTSCSVLLRACPMCRAPVTLGGGMTMLKGWRSSLGRAAKYCCSCQWADQRCCAAWGSYCLSSSVGMGFFFIVLEELVFKAVGQGQPAGLDDVFTDADS